MTAASSWTFPVNLKPGKNRIYTLKVKVDKCVTAGTLTLYTTVGATEGPEIEVRDSLSVRKNMRDMCGGVAGCAPAVVVEGFWR